MWTSKSWLENAARVKTLPTEEFPLEEPKKGLENPKLRRFLADRRRIVLVALIVGLFRVLPQPREH